MDRPLGSALNHLRIRHLRLIDTLVNAGSLHKAAKALHMSQPAASGMLHEAERAFGATLFNRTRKGVQLNDQGAIALARLRTVLAELRIIGEELKPADSLPVLRIGTLQHAFYGLLQSFLPEFLIRTNCRVEIIEGSDLLKPLEHNELDCMIGRMPATWVDSLRSRGFFYQPLYEFETCVLAAPSHPLARRRKVTLEELSRFEWILSRQGSNSRYALIAAFAAAGLAPPRVRIETSSFVFTLPLLPVSECLTVAPLVAGLHYQKAGAARILPIKLRKLLTPVAFVAQESAMMNPNIRALWECVREAVRSPHPAKTKAYSAPLADVLAEKL
jgi:DNA-binding transcriptional LysR family regulator